MRFGHDIRVGYADTDQMGVVHHSNYFRYLEAARTAYMAELGSSYRALEEEGFALPVRQARLRCRAPAHFDDELVVYVSVGRIRAASVAFDYTIERPADGTLIATAEIELACISLAGERPPTLLPKALREALDSACTS